MRLLVDDLLISDMPTVRLCDTEPCQQLRHANFGVHLVPSLFFPSGDTN